MNKILQQRIDEAKQKEYPVPPMVYGAICKAIVMVEQTAYTKGATFALQNQWISVDEALPKEDIPNCFVAYKAMDMVLYSTGSYEKDNDEWYVDGVGFNAEVTHWMPIPELKGDEK